MFALTSKKTLRTAALAMAAAGAMILGATTFSHQAEAGIANTRHNLGGSNTNFNRVTNSNGEICVFCHTPHGSSTTAAAPLWNKKLADPTSYTKYTSTTLDGSVDLTNSMSLACLTCHDGTQAMDTVLNAPGSGGYDANGARMKASDGSALTWTGSSVNADGTLKAGVTNLGTDLSNDHPVGIQYANSSAGSTGDADFVQAKQVGTKNVWHVDNAAGLGTANSKDKYDMILYTKSDNKPYVECATCHDPHTENTTFLRIPNTNSQVCLTCHTK